MNINYYFPADLTDALKRAKRIRDYVALNNDECDDAFSIVECAIAMIRAELDMKAALYVALKNKPF
jgi:hypothetical protein